MTEKIVHNNEKIMLDLKSTFAGKIQRADFMHSDVVISGGDIGDSTTS